MQDFGTLFMTKGLFALDLLSARINTAFGNFVVLVLLGIGKCNGGILLLYVT
jgi:hypothetical protein